MKSVKLENRAFDVQTQAAQPPLAVINPNKLTLTLTL